MSYNEINRLSLEKGFFAPSCEIYSDTPAGFWEYGPMGVSLRNRYVEIWRKEILRRDDIIEIDGSQIMPRSVFQASGHLESFSDPVTTCQKCRSVFRADRIIHEKTGKAIPERLSDTELDNLLTKYNIKCTSCGSDLGNTQKFNMMFKVGIGPTHTEAYLRPETAQSIFVDFPRLFKVMRCKLPVAFAQFGKSFRNEISPRQGFMRLREFYQAEIEVFFNVENADSFEKFDEIAEHTVSFMRNDEEVEMISIKDAVSKKVVPNKLIGYYIGILHQFYEKTGIDMSRLRFREVDQRDRAFYSQFTIDLEVKTSLGWIELVACNYRTDYDIKRHGEVSKHDLSVLDDDKKVIPHIFELSMGVDRSVYCIMEHAFRKDEKRILMKFKPTLAPIQVGIFPLVNKEGLPEKARAIHNLLKKNFSTVYDSSGSIGRRYRRLDEIGVPTCVTIDHQTMEDDTVTIRYRDSMNQKRECSSDIEDILTKIMSGHTSENLI